MTAPMPPVPRPPDPPGTPSWPGPSVATWPATADPADGGTSWTVAVKGCCGVLVGDWCDCAAWDAECATALAAPIILPRHAPGLEPLTDPALRGAA